VVLQQQPTNSAHTSPILYHICFPCCVCIRSAAGTTTPPRSRHSSVTAATAATVGATNSTSVQLSLASKELFLLGASALCSAALTSRVCAQAALDIIVWHLQVLRQQLYTLLYIHCAVACCAVVVSCIPAAMNVLRFNELFLLQERRMPA
jgi:hypothetical protein